MAKRTAPSSSPTDAPPLVYDRVELDFVAAEMREAEKRSRKGGSPATLFLGAGLSKSAGIPLANEFVERILRDDHFKTRFLGRKTATDPDDEGKVLTYPECMDELTPTERRDVIGPFMEEATLNRAHLAIAQLMKHGYVDRILTVNFDPLLVKACALVGEFPAVYDLATAQDFAPQLMQRKAICYLHGQALGAFLVNTGAEGRKQAKRLAPLLHDTFRDRFVLVAGYSGQNDPLLQAFLSAGAFERHLVWTCYEQTPGTHLKTLLQTDDKQPRYAHALPGQDADTFFVELAEALGCWPPNLLFKPLEYLREVFDLIDDGQRLKESLETAQLIWQEEGVETLLQAVSNLWNRKFTEAEQMGREGFANYAGKPIERKFRELTAWTLSDWGLQLRKRSNQEPMLRIEHLSAAIDKFKQAVTINPDDHEALGNWGRALVRLSDAEPEHRADHLNAAIDKFEQAVTLQPDDHGALYNWGVALGKLADSKPDRRVEHLNESIDKFKQAVDVAPGYHEALYNWGVALGQLADAEPQQRVEHLNAAIDKFEQAIDIKSNLHEALNNWGVALAKLADAEPQRRVEHLNAAIDKYEQAFTLQPGDHKASNNWGIALGKLADVEPERRAEHLKAAIAKFEQAVAVTPDMHEALSNWGVALIFLARETNDILLLDEAEQKFQAADQIAPGSSGKALSLLAEIRAKVASEHDAPEEPAPPPPKRRRAKKGAG